MLPRRPQGLPAGKDYVSLACPTASECWMSGNTPVNLRGGGMSSRGTGAIVLSSANGGRTWQATRLPKGMSSIDAISCPNPLYVLCAGVPRGGRNLIGATGSTPFVCTVGLHGSSSLGRAPAPLAMLTDASPCPIHGLSAHRLGDGLGPLWGHLELHPPLVLSPAPNNGAP